MKLGDAVIYSHNSPILLKGIIGYLSGANYYIYHNDDKWIGSKPFDDEPLIHENIKYKYSWVVLARDEKLKRIYLNTMKDVIDREVERLK